MKKKSNLVKKILIIILCVILALLLALTATFFIIRNVGRSKFKNNNTPADLSTFEDVEINEDEVTYESKTYIPNENIVNIVFMGIDKESINDELGYGKNGQADSIFVAAIDTKAKTVKIIPLSRETMTDVNIYSSGGEFIESKREQLCLAYNYGNSPENCSKNVIESIKRTLYGINIDSYVTVDLSGVGKMADVIGGVKLNALEEITVGGKKVKIGETLDLRGEKAVNYIRDRGFDVNANNRRMERQKQFLTSFTSKAGNNIIKNFSNLKTYYNTAVPYISTDLSFSQITYLTSSLVTKNFGNLLQFKSIPGKTKQGEKWIEFIPDKDAVLKLIIETYYVEKNSK